jgi:acetyl-CoA acetyltransferase
MREAVIVSTARTPPVKSHRDLWELAEAFASQSVHCAEQLGIPSAAGLFEIF